MRRPTRNQRLMTSAASEARPVVPSEPASQDFYERTRFWTVARRYGLSALLLTWGSAFATVAASALVVLYCLDVISVSALKALAVAYTSIAAALFGIVLAGLAVVAAFFDKQYAALLREHGVLDRALFGFWWVAALAVVALFASIAFIVTAWATRDTVPLAIALGLSSVTFAAALGEALALVGSLMRHGLYRAELAHRELTVTRQP